MRSLSSLLVVMATPAFAQTAAEEGPAPAEIVVTGYGLPAAIGESAYDVVTIDRDRLTSSASGRIEDLLRDVAGFAQFRRSDARSAHPTSQGATLRGLGGNASSRALVLLDGVPQIDPFGGWVDWAALDPVRLGQIKVTRGGGSGVSGPGALAGTIALSSAGPNDLAPVWGGVAYGSRHSVDADAGVSGRIGGGFAALSVSYARGDGFVPIIRSQRGPADVAADYEQYSVAVRAVSPLTGDIELQASGLAFHDARSRGLAETNNSTTGADASLRLVGRGRWGWEALGYLQLRAFASGFAAANAARDTVTPSLDQYNVPALGRGARFELRPPLGDGIELRIGGDWRDLSGRTKENFLYDGSRFTQRRETGGATITAGAFADASVRAASGVTLTGGARIDRWWLRDGFLDQTNLTPERQDYENRAGWRPTGRAGMAWQPARAITIRSAAYLGWRLPTLNELYRPFRVGQDATLANPDLSPERMKGIDGGVDYRPLSNVQLSATIFWNRLENGVANVTQSIVPATGAVTRLRENIGAIRARGAEFDARIGWAAWQLSASYAFVDARVEDHDVAPDLDGLRPAQTPRHQASATLAWNRGVGLRAALTARYVAAQYEDDQNSRRLGDAVTFDAATAIPIAGKLSAEFRAENLADTRVDAGISATGIVERATPRTLWIGVRYGG